MITGREATHMDNNEMFELAERLRDLKIQKTELEQRTKEITHCSATMPLSTQAATTRPTAAASMA